MYRFETYQRNMIAREAFDAHTVEQWINVLR